MKGVPGLLIAVGLGIVGAFCNWMYLAQMGKDMQTLDFIGVSKDTKINAGDKFTKEHFVKISIPGNNLGNLDNVAVKWEALATVVGQPATKSYSPGEILLWHDLRTPPEMDIKRLLAADERVLWIPVDTRTFVPSLVNAGDKLRTLVHGTSAEQEFFISFAQAWCTKRRPELEHLARLGISGDKIVFSGVGKSRAATKLAICGATGADFFGMSVHRKFRTMILQCENGRVRLKSKYERELAPVCERHGLAGLEVEGRRDDVGERDCAAAVQLSGGQLRAGFRPMRRISYLALDDWEHDRHAVLELPGRVREAAAAHASARYVYELRHGQDGRQSRRVRRDIYAHRHRRGDAPGHDP
jgi:hypothetical protein